jgi:hypothetical protein
MKNCSDKLFKFYDEKVRLKDKHDKLREYRDTNLDRVKSGIKLLEIDDKRNYPNFSNDCSQGSMAMHTINQAQHGEDHDIDHALIFDGADLAAEQDSGGIRELVLRAIVKSGGNFKTEPEARENAVTIWYADGYHVDLAIYKKANEFWDGEVHYHAGKDWTKRDPQAITNWFDEKNKELSPAEGFFSAPTVSDHQFRRIVRLIKFWAKSRSGWSMPSGLVLTVLAAECFKKDDHRDDLALVNTLNSIAQRLLSNKEVYNPTEDGVSLLRKDDHHKQIISLQEKIDQWVPALIKTLSNRDCSDLAADNAWEDFFNNTWWTGEQRKKALALSQQVPVDVIFFRKSNSIRIKYNPDSDQHIPKGMSIRFTAKPNLPAGYSIKWAVKNNGDEAEWDGQHILRDGKVDPTNPHICNETTKYRGDHTMICEVTSGRSIFRNEIPIRIR